MRVVVNEPLIRRRGRIGQVVSWLGLGILLAGMIVSFRANPAQPDYARWIGLSLVCLAVGFIAANIGGYFMRRWGRRPRPDELLASALKGFDDRHVLFAWSVPAPLTLLTPRGLYVFATRDQGGTVYHDGQRWRQPWGLRRLLTFFAQEGLGNPTADALDDAERLRRFIASNLPDLAEVPIYPIVVFLHPQTDLQVNNAKVPVMPVKKLKTYLRGEGKGEPLQAEHRHALAALFGLPGKNGRGQEEGAEG